MTAGLVSSQFLMYGAIKEGKSSIKDLITELTEKNSSDRSTSRVRDSQS